MPGYRIGRIAALPLVALLLGGCASAANPWRAHDLQADLKTATGDAQGTCLVVFSNATDVLIDAGYASLGVESRLGLIPAGHSVQFGLACSVGAIEAYAVRDGASAMEPVRYWKARLETRRATRLSITSADRIH